MSYIYNPKAKGSGIITAIPQKGRCPNNCEDCFFQNGRSYLEPLEENLPNMPSKEQARGMVVRVNDGNDSNNQQAFVIEACKKYDHKFYNTSMPINLGHFDAPVVLTVNPGNLVDKSFWKLDTPPKNLMYVRVLTNTWNAENVKNAVAFYTKKEIPTILTFMAYHDHLTIPFEHRTHYILRKRTINEYFAIKRSSFLRIMSQFEKNPLVFSCGNEGITSSCRFCGNCLREYFVTIERMKK